VRRSEGFRQGDGEGEAGEPSHRAPNSRARQLSFSRAQEWSDGYRVTRYPDSVTSSPIVTGKFPPSLADDDGDGAPGVRIDPDHLYPGRSHPSTSPGAAWAR
jgi:hypothetical protein